MTWAPWAEVLFREMLHGVIEEAGPKHNPRILEYWSAVDTFQPTDDETSWCAAAMNWALMVVGVRGPRRPNARSFLSWGERCDGRLGGIAVLWRGSPDGWQGHVGILVGEAPRSGEVLLLGGNQGNRVGINSYSASRLLGYRRPQKSDYYVGTTP